MKRRKWLGLLLAAVMVLTMVPTMAFAEGDHAFEVIDSNEEATQFYNVKSACNAMEDGCTLKLLKNYVSTDDYNFGISIPGDARDVTIDLNGYSVTSNNPNPSSGYALKVEQNYGGARNNTVTIKNSGAKQSVLTSSSYQIMASSGDSRVNQIIKIEGDIVFKDIDREEPLGISLETGAKLLDTESARDLVPNGGFSVEEEDGDNYIYGNLANAASKSVDGNITLLHDYEGNNKINSGTKNVTLDLNRHTYTYTGAETAIDVNYPNVTLTVKNGKVIATDENAAGATLIGTPYESQMNNRGLILEEVELTVRGNVYGIVTNGTESGNTVTLRNSMLNAENGFGIYFPSDGSVTIDNSVINARNAGVQLCAGDLTVTGDTVITVTGQPQEKTENDGAIVDGAAISIVNRDGYKALGTVNIESGDFNSASNVEAVKAYSFNNTNKSEEEWNEAGDVVEVTGGSFSSNIAENIVKSDMQATATLNGETKVVIGKQTVENVIANLKAGDKIEFQLIPDDVTVNIPEGVEVTNSTGKDMTINDDMLAAGETVTIEKDSTNPDPAPEEPSEQPSTDNPQGDESQIGSDQGKTDGSTPEKPTKDTEPPTGDDSNIAIPLTAAGLALAAMAAVVATRRRHS